MLEDTISNYRRMCTRTGQFEIILNTWFLLIVIFGIGGMIGLTIFIKLGTLPELIRFYLSLLAIIVMEFIYFSIAQFHIFYKQKNM